MIIFRQMPDAKKHSDNTIIMVQPIIQVQNFEFRHRITQNILYNDHPLYDHSFFTQCHLFDTLMASYNQVDSVHLLLQIE